MEALDAEVFEMIALEKSCDIAFPIKEKMLIEVTKQFTTRFSSKDGILIFGGGTSLVCAYNELTKRFSEDADFRFVSNCKSTKSIRNDLIHIAETLDGFKLVDTPLSDSHKLEFRFKDKFDFVQKHSSLRPYIKVEIFFTSDLFYEAQKRTLISSYNKMLGLEPEAQVLCVSLQDTAIDKISSFLWRMYSQETDNPQYKPEDIRHLHDLTFLLQQFVVDDEFKEHVKKVVSSDINSRIKKDISCDTIVDYVINELINNKRYEKEFIQYVSNISYAKTAEQLKYHDAVRAFRGYALELQLIRV